jgi:outer membrane receptor protein involved in Fe transport
VAWHSHGIEPYGRVASGFRAPNLEERYFRGPVHGGMLVYGDPSLVPETNITYEAGVRANADGWGSARLSAYRVYAEHFISLDYLGLFFGQARFQYANLDRVQIDGLEFTGPSVAAAAPRSRCRARSRAGAISRAASG